MIPPKILFFGSSSVTTLTLSGTEQFCLQHGISELTQHDLRTKYVPLVTNDANVWMETRIYVSNDAMNVADADSTWYPYCYDNDDGSGNFSPVQRVYRSPAISTSSAIRNPNRSFPIGARKIRFGFLEVGSPASPGSIAEGLLNSHI